MPDPLRIGLIGLGVAGQRHAAACRKEPAVVLVGAADPAPAAVAAAGDLGIPCYPGFEELLDGARPEAVIISLQHAALRTAAVACALRGLHVLVEKPMGVTVREADDVIAAARAGRVRLMVNFVHRFRAEYRQAKHLLETGVVGRPVLILDSMTSGRSTMPAWVWDRTVAGGGMMMYNGVHSIDRLAWLTGRPIARVSAAMGTFCYPVDVEDTLAGVAIFDDGALGVVIQHKSGTANTLGGWETTVWGTQGAIKVSGGVLEVASDKVRSRLQVEEDDRFLGALREFVASIAEGRDPAPGGTDGRRALAAVAALYEASATGHAVDVVDDR